MFNRAKRAREILLSESSSTYVQYFRFVVSGGIAAGIAVLSFYLLVASVGMHHLLANTISYFIGLSTEYLLNTYWVFHAAKNTGARRVTSFVVISLGCLLLSNLVIYALVDLGLLDRVFSFRKQENLKLVAKVISVVLNSLWDFSAKRLIVFRKKHSARTKSRSKTADRSP